VDYNTPLDEDRLAREQPLARAGLCDRLETMFTTLQQQIETQTLERESGVDIRLFQLQQNCLKLQAQLWGLSKPPPPQPEPEPDPETARIDAEQAARANLARMQERLADERG
jgi:hypothetical protein